jgi:hypothetical protein
MFAYFLATIIGFGFFGIVYVVKKNSPKLEVFIGNKKSKTFLRSAIILNLTICTLGILGLFIPGLSYFVGFISYVILVTFLSLLE